MPTNSTASPNALGSVLVAIGLLLLVGLLIWAAVHFGVFNGAPAAGNGSAKAAAAKKAAKGGSSAGTSPTEDSTEPGAPTNITAHLDVDGGSL